MKEKITTILTLGCIFSLFFYYKVYSPSDVVLSNHSSVTNEEVVQKLMDKITEDNHDNSLSESKEEDIRKARHLVTLLADERADNYEDWIRIRKRFPHRKTALQNYFLLLQHKVQNYF